jgi:hypothetical protein
MDCVHHIVSAVWEENSNLSDDSDKTGPLALLAALSKPSDESMSERER